MNAPLRALIVEDSEDDALLVLRELRRRFDATTERVETAEGMIAALERTWDVVISDWSIPQFSAMAAFSIVKEKGLDLPFLIVSGTIGEDAAVQAMRAGVHDFLLKDQLVRLNPAIERELREAANRREAKTLHEQLLISDRMASVGTLAAGVAHEINNPLAIILANLDFATRESSKPDQRAGDEVVEALREARDAGERVREIVRDLKIFSRSSEERSFVVDVERVLESSIRMTRNETRHHARVVKCYAPIPQVEANDSRLGQVFVNLLINAAQAIPEGDAEHNEIRVTTGVDGSGLVFVEVRDTGAGIPPQNLSRIFDAFFTTKPIGVGTGLGLSICHRIVAGFGGEITVESQVGKGTAFRILLPPARSEALEKALPSVSSSRPARRGRILVVDDEAMIGMAVRRTLSSDHDVTAMTSAEGALEVLRKGQRFDVILCDLMMPQMTGMDLHAEILRVAPDQAAQMIFLTGGAFTPKARSFLDEVPNQRVEKPFDTQHLRALINDRVR